MPVTSRHAFARGQIFSQGGRLGDFFGRLAHKFASRFLEWTGSRAALHAFQVGASVAGGLRVGPDAWCYNNGPREAVMLEQDVVCRGILRREDWAEGHIHIGSQTYIGDDCIVSCAESIHIGKMCMLAHGVQIFDNDTHPLDSLERERDYWLLQGRAKGSKPEISKAPVHIGDRVWIGFSVIILKGVTIGNNSVIAAGSVITKNIPEDSLAVGNPARVIRKLV